MSRIDQINYRDLRVGDTVPHDPGRPIVGGDITCPTRCPGRRLPSGGYSNVACLGHWHALLVAPGEELRRKNQLLEDEHVSFAFVPTRERKWVDNGKVKTMDVPIVGRFVYARFTAQPQWDLLATRRIVQGVVSQGETPLAIPSHIARQLQGLADAEAELTHKETYLDPGDKAEISTGPFSGLSVRIVRVVAGQAFWETSSFKGKSPLRSLMKIWENG